MRMGTNLPKVGSYNRAVVLEAIQVSDGISRVQIAKHAGLTAQTVSVIVRKLLEEGLVVEDGSLPSSGGKPRTILRVDPAAGYAVGIHFDPGEISYVLADLAGQPVTVLHTDVRPGLSPEEVIRQMARTARDMLRHAGVPDHKVLGIGLACPGPLDADGVMNFPPRLSGWDQVPIKRLLEEHTGFPVTFDNDAAAAAIGERWAGLARATASFAYLYLGTGIGGGLFLDNQIYRGRSLNAAEFGHITVMPDGPDCYCGNRGCVEAICCPSAIEAAVRTRLAEGAGSMLAAGPGNGPEKDPGADPAGGPGGPDHAAICAAAAEGDPLAREVIDMVAARLADAAVSIVNMLDIDLLVLGGPAMHKVGHIYHQVIAEAVASRPLARRLHQVHVETSPIAADAAAIGAASLVFHATYAPRLGTLLTS
ncbi:ROK family transcriptional regulator [Sphaerisporangium perillae]|uniref:ROK family transcriptional regulator n=1 Tax=Sphaerisporangium perillae TaxID=2935860 RepID=UPI00200C1825|nr:ROK family transcriptional regulator [Sphaerisporangium perillae]